MGTAKSPSLDETVRWLSNCIAIPVEVEKKARLLLLDTFGCLLAGLRHQELRTFGETLSLVFPGEDAWPSTQHKLGPAGLAALGAAAACWDEGCEGNSEAHGRPGLPVVPAVLALCAQSDVALKDALLALVTGYEIGARAGEIWRIPAGWHVDGSWHSIGVAAAVARMISGPGAIQAAVETAACQLPASLYLPISAGSVVRNTYPSHGVLLGFLAASAAAAGLKPPVGALQEARIRILQAHGEPSFTAPGEWTILAGYLKPFAGVRHTHYGVQAAVRIRQRPEFSFENISAIKLRTYSEAVQYCGNRTPRTIIQAQFSLSYAVAAALRFGDLGLEAYNNIDEPAVSRLENLIEIEVDQTQLRRGAVLVVQIGNSMLEERIDGVLGDLEMPMTQEHVQQKFVDYARRALGGDRAEALAVSFMKCDASLPLQRCLSLEQR